MDALQNPAWFVNFHSLPKNHPLLLFTLLLIMSNHARLLSIPQWATLDFALVYWHTLFLLLKIFFLLSLQVVTSISFLGSHFNINISERSLLIFLLLNTHIHLACLLHKTYKINFFASFFLKKLIFLSFCNVNSLR